MVRVERSPLVLPRLPLREFPLDLPRAPHGRLDPTEDAPQPVVNVAERSNLTTKFFRLQTRQTEREILERALIPLDGSFKLVGEFPLSVLQRRERALGMFQA